MGGGYRKFKKAEKAKVKLKGAKLPKGANVTKTNFKVKKIIIPEQIRDRNLNEALSSRKLSFHDCISRLRHSNSSSRSEGLRGLRDIVTKHPAEIIDNHLGATIQAVASISVDLERDVRRDCYKTFASIFSATPQQNILPFFDILSSYLRCAMTHIQPSIQEDSLLLLDTYLQYVPQLVLLNRDKIFPHFMDMISKLRSESKPERTLTLSLNKQSTSTKWRTRVLMRLYGMLKIMIDDKKDKKRFVKHVTDCPTVEDDGTPFATKVNEITSENMETDNIFDYKNPMFFPIVKQNLHETCSLAFLFKKTIGQNSLNLSDQIDEGLKIKMYVQMLMPLMFESWLEVKPTIIKGDFNTEHVISNEAATTLNLLLEISIQLWELVVMYCRSTNNNDMCKWFREEYNEDFCLHLMTGFPFTQSAPNKKEKKASKEDLKERNVDEKCYQQNFNICYFYCCLNEQFRSDDNKSYEKIIIYVEDCITNWKFKNPEVTTILMKVLRYILIETNTRSVNQNTKELLKTLLGVYIQAQLPQEIRNKILILFCDIIVLNDNLWREYGLEIFTLWLKMLPSLLCKPLIDFNVLKAFLCLAKQNNDIFINSLDEKVYEIIENVPKIRVANEKYTNEGLILIVNLIFWIKNESTLNDLLEKINTKQIKMENNLQIYLKSTIQTKLMMISK